jgi:hypothetical protein
MAKRLKLMEINKKQYKENSTQRISDIKEMQAKHKRDLIQPRIEGEINPEFIHEFGAKHLNISQHDVERMAKKSQRLAGVLDQKRRQQER